MKRIAILVVGGTVLVIGVVMIVLPGPAFLVIPAGLAILAVEFAWARRWLRSAKAVLPKPSNPAWRKNLSLKSIRRSGEFLLRQIGRTFTRKKVPHKKNSVARAV